MGRARYGKKNGQAGRSLDLVQKNARVTHGRKMAPKLMTCCKPEQEGTKEDGKCENELRPSNMAGSLPRRRGIGRLKDKRQELQGKNTGDCGMSSKREDSWPRKVCGASPKKKMLQDRGALP